MANLLEKGTQNILPIFIKTLDHGEIVELDQSKSIGDETDGESEKEEQTRAFCFRYLSR